MLREPSLVDAIVSDAARNGYHPRSDKQSIAQSRRIVADLLNRCPILRERGERGEIVVKFTHHQRVGHEDWKIDVAIGTAVGQPVPLPGGINEAPPALIQIAIELKSIWTEHGKAKKNRFRDFGAFHSHAHRCDPKIVAGAFVVVNASDQFYSPLNLKRDDESGGPITKHGGAGGTGKLAAQKCVELFRSIHLRNSDTDLPGLEALSVAVVEHDNFAFMPPALRERFGNGKPSRVIPTAPAPQPGDPLHYETFLQRLCTQYRARFT